MKLFIRVENGIVAGVYCDEPIRKTTEIEVFDNYLSDYSDLNEVNEFNVREDYFEEEHKSMYRIY